MDLSELELLDSEQRKEFSLVTLTQNKIAKRLIDRGFGNSINVKLKLQPKFFLRPQINSVSSSEVKQLDCETVRSLPEEMLLAKQHIPLSRWRQMRLKPFSSRSNCRGLVCTGYPSTSLVQPKPIPTTPIRSTSLRHLVSLVIPVYNRDKYLKATIDSILAQTHTNFELVIWDDGSTDDSLAIATEYAKEDSRIKVFIADNTGQGAALVKAIAFTKGKYLGTVDSDDLLHPEALSKTFKVLEFDSSIGMVYTDHLVIDEFDKAQGLGKRCSIPYSKERLLVDFMTFHFRLMRRDVYDAVGGIDANLGTAEDYDLCLRLSEVTKIEHLAEPLYYYRWHLDNISHTKQLEQVKCSTIAVNQALQRRGLSQELRLEVKLNPSYKLQRQSKVANKVFGIGLSKTGTTSLNDALSLLGIPSIHLPRSIEQVEEFDGATDIPIALAYKELDLKYPGSKFVLTIRESNSWLNSQQFHKERVVKILDEQISQWIQDLDTQCYGQWEYDPSVWLSTYKLHLQSVLEYFQGRESDLLILNICQGEGWKELCTFLGCSIPNSPFPHQNKKVFNLISKSL